jgi:UDP-N-acetylmuramate dehydrogenase
MNIINSKSLLQYNTFKVDVVAELFTTIKSENDLIELLQNKRVVKKNKFILGGGSNILLTKNIEGLVIHNQIKGIHVVKEDEKSVEVAIGAGEIWDNLVSWSTKNKYYGIENLSLIPGSVGAAPIQNIGAYGCELKDTFLKLEAINLDTLEKVVFNKFDCKFGYRDSIFKNKLKNKFIITKVYLQLGKKKKLNLNYERLQEKIDPNHMNSEDVRNIIIDIRKEKLPDPKNLGNAGSFFKNPIINQNDLSRLRKEYPKIPYFIAEQIKLPAAWLIEQLNWKGYKAQTCGVYDQHSLIIINHNNATGEEIMNLAKKIKNNVYQKFNILLEEEVLII